MLLINKVYNKRSTLILLKTCLSSHLIRDMNNSGLTNGEFLLCSFLINGYKHSDVCNVMLCNNDQGHVQQCFSYIVAVSFLDGGNRINPQTTQVTDKLMLYRVRTHTFSGDMH
jgi:hypothetical protein